jgi:D-glycero-D-manno-heptose 1,7-bisphosphate phosphatase
MEEEPEGMSRRGIFLDRDGTVCEEVGYAGAVERLRLLPRAAEAIRRINGSGFLALLVTNQSGVARGLFDEATVDAMHQRLTAWLAAEGARLDGIYVCPHHPSEGEPPYRADCDCRKPRPGLLTRAAREHDVDLSASYMIGDKAADIETARNAGATGILVRTGYGSAELAQRLPQAGAQPAFVAQDLLAAVEWILAQERNGS